MGPPEAPSVSGRPMVPSQHLGTTAAAAAGTYLASSLPCNGGGGKEEDASLSIALSKSGRIASFLSSPRTAERERRGGGKPRRERDGEGSDISLPPPPPALTRRSEFLDECSWRSIDEARTGALLCFV